MNSRLESIYLNSPFFIKRIFANLEAFRRDYFRKYGDYNSLLEKKHEDNYVVNGFNDEIILKKFNYLLKNAYEKTRFYNNEKYNCNIMNLTDLKKLPTLTKDDLRSDLDSFFVKNTKKSNLFQGQTSGSTGTPLQYFVDKISLRQSKAYQEAFLKTLGHNKSSRVARISGVKIVPFSTLKPPFWVYIDLYRQLQCSAFHINEDTVSSYVDALNNYKIEFGTGYPSAWLFLAEIARKKNINIRKLRAIVTDSEGMNKEEQNYIEDSFGCKVYQTYGLSEICCFSIMCSKGHYHLFPENVIVEILDDNNKPLGEGEEGNIVVTDLNSIHFPYIRYVTGDIGSLGIGECACGWKSKYLSSVTGKVDDYIISPDGRKISRLGHIMKSAKGVLKSQLIQTDLNTIIIKLIPDDDFDLSSIKLVEENAKNYIGNIKLRFELVNELEKNPRRGKVPYIIRRIT